MKNRITRALAGFGAVMALTFGASVIEPAATAQPAEAVNYYNCKTYYQYGWYKVTECYHDYSFWEEVVGYKDGWYRTNTANV